MESTIDQGSTSASETECNTEPTSQHEVTEASHEGTSISDTEKSVSIDTETNVANKTGIESYEIFQQVEISKVIPENHEHVFKKPFPYKASGHRESVKKSTITSTDTGCKKPIDNQTVVTDVMSNEMVQKPPSIDVAAEEQKGSHIETVIEKQSSTENTSSKVPLEEDITTEEQTAMPVGTGDKESPDIVKKEISKKDTDNQSMKEVCKKRSLSDEDDTENSLLVERILPPEDFKKRKVNLFTEDMPPHWYDVKGNIVTKPIIPTNLPKVFEFLPIFGKPSSKDMLNDFLNTKVREFVGCDLGDEDFEELSKYCSPDHLKTGNELIMQSNIPTQGLLKSNIIKDSDDEVTQFAQGESNLCTNKKYQLRLDRDPNNKYTKKLKYRGVRLMPLQEEDSVPSTSEPELEPGKDLLFRVRIYRPYAFTLPRDRIVRGRHSVFSSDIVLLGRQSLTELRDRIVCRNELDMRVDVSAAPDVAPTTTAKEVFPSGFLFINNVFYVDGRAGCADRAGGTRAWAAARGLGAFAARDMARVRLHHLALRLGHPDVYVHQGNCEHVFVFSELRLLNVSDPLSVSHYPCHTAISQNQTVYCTTCAEFGAKWIVVGCDRVPFDPAFFCETCFKLYLYKDGEKIGDFKAYSYRGNEMNMLKSHRHTRLREFDCS